MAFVLGVGLASLGFLVIGASLAYGDVISRTISEALSRRYFDLGAALWARPKSILFGIIAIAVQVLGTFVVVFIPGSMLLLLATLVHGQGRLPRAFVPLLFGAALVGMVCGAALRRTVTKY